MLLNFQNKLVSAINEGNMEDIKKLVLGSNDIDKPLLPMSPITPNPISKRIRIPKIYGPTPLVLAILCENTEIVKYLIEDKGANVEIIVSGMFPIHYAALVGIPEILICIIKRSLREVNRLNNFFYSPLHIACGNENLQAVIVLLDNGADPNSKSPSLESGDTPLHVSMRNKDKKIVELLLSKHANFQEVNQKNEKPIDTAQYYQNEQMYEFLKAVTIDETYIIPPYEVLSTKYSNCPDKIDRVLELLANSHC